MIEVQVGDTIVEFPDGTAPDVMQKALRTQFPPVVQPQAGPRQAGSAVEEAIRPITSYPEVYSQMNRESREQMGRGLEQLTAPTGGDLLGSAGAAAKGVGNLALGGLGYIASPIAAGLRTTLGNPLEETTGVPKEITETIASLGLPIPKRIPMPSLARAEKAVPKTTEELFQSATGKYEAARDADFAVAPDMTEMLKGQISDKLHRQGFRPSNPAHKPVFEAIDELPTGKYADVSDFDNARQVLQNSGANSQAVRTAIREIDDFVTPKVPELKGARADYAAASRSEDFEQAMEKANRATSRAHSGMNYDNAVRQAASSLRSNEKMMRGWNDAEKAKLDEVIAGSRVGNIARGLGKGLGGGGGAWSAIVAFKTLGLGPAAGYGFKKLGDALTTAKAAQLDVMLRSRPDLTKQISGPLTDFGTAAQEATVSPTARNLSRLTLASRNLSTNLKDADISIAPNDLLKSLFGKPAEADE